MNRMRPSNLNFQDGGMVNGSPYDIDSAPEVTGIRPARKRKNCGERVYGFLCVFSRASYLIPAPSRGREIFIWSRYSGLPKNQGDMTLNDERSLRLLGVDDAAADFAGAGEEVLQ